MVLTRTLRQKLVELNPDLPDAAYDEAIRSITSSVASQPLVQTNREKHNLVRDGVQVTFRNDKGERVRDRLRVIDFDDPENNHFLCARELWVKGDLYRSPQRKTTVQNLRQAIENRVCRLLERNPLRADFQRHYEKIVAEYNREKDRVTIEQTFEALLEFIEVAA